LQFKEQPTVVDAPHAEKLTKCGGEIAIKDVHFSYDSRKPALRGLDFVAKPGTTTAFVGESGGGKTTVLRLLFRFYNIEEGSIEVDGGGPNDELFLKNNIITVTHILLCGGLSFYLDFLSVNYKSPQDFIAGSVGLGLARGGKVCIEE